MMAWKALRFDRRWWDYVDRVLDTESNGYDCNMRVSMRCEGVRDADGGRRERT